MGISVYPYMDLDCLYMFEIVFKTNLIQKMKKKILMQKHITKICLKMQSLK